MSFYESYEHDGQQVRATTDEFMLLLEALSGISLTLLFLIDRGKWEYFWFAAFLLSIALSRLITTAALFYPADYSRDGLCFFVLKVCFELSLLALLLVLLRGRKSLLFYFAAIGLVLAEAYRYVGWSIFFLPFGNRIILLTELPDIAMAWWMLSLVIRRASQGSLDARLLLLPVAVDAFIRLETVYESIRSMVNPNRTYYDFSSLIILHKPFVVQVEVLTDLFFMLAMLVILFNRFIRTRREEERVATELEAARTVQQVLIPEELPSIAGLTITTAYHPAQEVGGDFFQIVELIGGETLIVLGDVSGKGLSAAMTVSLIVGAVRTLSEFTSSPAEIAAGLNRRLLGRGSGFTTCLILRISPQRSVTMVNAGHLAPYLNGREMSGSTTLPLGLVADFPSTEELFHFAEGDRLTLVTDGVPEAARQRELFGFPRTEELSEQPADTIADAARAFGQTDDITVMSIVFGAQTA